MEETVDYISNGYENYHSYNNKSMKPKKKNSLKDDWNELDKTGLLIITILGLVGVGIFYMISRLCNC